jgi:uncharacterized protein (TIGR02757 family)
VDTGFCLPSNKTRDSGQLKTFLDRLHEGYHRREFVHPDPLEVLYRFDKLRDREVAALVVGSLAYGRVAQILKSVSVVLEKMSPSPYRFVRHHSDAKIVAAFPDFKHRFTTGAQLASMLVGLKHVLKRYGCLQTCFMAGFRHDSDTAFDALSFFTGEIVAGAGQPLGHLLPLPQKGSACKRLHLFLRWMVRKDEVDPGGWEEIPRSALIVPVDAHMHRIGRQLGLTQRRTADLQTAMEITNRFRAIVPEDPVKYDFCLTRIGIRKDACREVVEMFR